MRSLRASALVLAFALAGIHANGNPPDTENLARQAAAAHQYARACELYRQLIAENPRNAENWISVGRLSGYLGQFGTALQAYEAALAIAPQDVDALVGKAYVLLWQHRYAEAELVLNRAREIAPLSTDVNLATARRYYYLHEPALALRYAERALQSDPANADALSLNDLLIPRATPRLEFDLSGDKLPYAPTGLSFAAGAGWTSSISSFSLHAEDWDRYGQNVFRGGLEISRTFNYRWVVEGSSLWSSRGDVLPRWDNSFALRRKLKAGWVIGAQYRDLLFDTAHVQLASPQAEYYFERPIWLDAGYSRSWTSLTPLAGVSAIAPPANSYSLGYHQRVHRVILHGGFSQGLQLFAIPTSNRLGDFRANTFLGGIEIPASKSWTTHFEYLQQRRSNGGVEQIFTAGLIFKRTHAP